VARRRTIPTASLSMMDLVSNALAGVIILFFILSSSKFPGIPPERVCGTLIIEFSMRKPDPNDMSRVFVEFKYDKDERFIPYSAPCFDKRIVQLDSVIQHFAGKAHCSDSLRNTGIANTVPAITAYQVVNQDTTQHTVILHDPPEGEWVIGLLYTHHTQIDNAVQSDSIAVSYTWYSNKEATVAKAQTKLIAPTSRFGTHLYFDAKQLKPVAKGFFSNTKQAE
jgi:hypothetical protein